MCYVGTAKGLGTLGQLMGKGLIALNIPKRIFLSETRCKEDEMTTVRRRLGMKSSFTVDWCNSSSDVNDLSEVGAILADCKRYMTAFNFISLKHICREANGVTHRLAHLASTSVLDEF
ncbi:hypothetical protein ACLB2K_012774 [Fragaria x ananassa]